MAGERHREGGKQGGSTTASSKKGFSRSFPFGALMPSGNKRLPYIFILIPFLSPKQTQTKHSILGSIRTYQVLSNLQARAQGRKTSTMISRLHTRRISLEVIFTHNIIESMKSDQKIEHTKQVDDDQHVSEIGASLLPGQDCPGPELPGDFC